MKKLFALAGLSLAMHMLPAHATVVSYNGFGNTAGLSLAGNAQVVTTADGKVVRLTSSGPSQGGAVYSTAPITLGSNATFSTTFQFRLTSPGGIDPADGFTFLLSNTSSGLGATGGGLGLPGGSKSVAIEFDTYNNGASDGNSSNHVGLDINGNTASTYLTSAYGVSNCSFGSYQNAGCMANGDLWTVTIGYDGSTLTAVLFDPAKNTSFVALDHYAVNIAQILGTNTAYVGFTGSTGSGYMNQDIVNWQFADTVELSQVPEPSSLALFALASAILGASLRRKR
jgi:hypothetical protein